MQVGFSYTRTYEGSTGGVKINYIYPRFSRKINFTAV